MKKRMLVGVALIAAAAIVGMVAMAGGQQDDLQEIIIFPGDGGDDCICTTEYAPVACWSGSLVTDPITVYTNACVAGCNGETNCKPYNPLQKG